MYCMTIMTINCGRQKEPAILISTLLLQTHAPQLYSLVLTRFCSNLESSTTNAWNAKNAIFSRASCVTFGPWITWRSCIAAAPTNPNRACQLGTFLFLLSRCMPFPGRIPSPGEVLPYMGCIGTCRGMGYGFWGCWPLNRVSFVTLLLLCSWCGPLIW